MEEVFNTKRLEKVLLFSEPLLCITSIPQQTSVPGDTAGTGHGNPGEHNVTHIMGGRALILCYRKPFW